MKTYIKYFNPYRFRYLIPSVPLLRNYTFYHLNKKITYSPMVIHIGFEYPGMQHLVKNQLEPVTLKHIFRNAFFFVTIPTGKLCRWRENWVYCNPEHTKITLRHFRSY